MAKTSLTNTRTAKKDGRISNILGVGVSGTPEGEVLSLVEAWLREDGAGREAKRLIFTPNSEFLVLAAEDEEFGKVLNSADLNIPDGIGVVWASRLLARSPSDQTISARLTGTDLFESLVALASRMGKKVFLLGGKEGEARAAKEKLLSRYGSGSKKGFEIEADAGPRQIATASLKERQELIGRINRFRPDFLFVAFGQGKQEKWLGRNRDKLNFRVGMGVGGAFNFVSGKSKRPPTLVGNLGFEWLWRLMLEPWRLGRQLKLFKFWWLVLREKFGV